MSENPIAHYPRNPNYGSGAYRRRIRLVRHDGASVGELEDCNHGFRVQVRHDGERITSIEPEFKRTPFNTCPGASTPLNNLIGARIDLDSRTLLAIANPTANCTHLLDLCILTINQITAEKDVHTWDVTVTDALNADHDLRVWRDGELLHHWRVRDTVMVQPAALAGNVMLRGFASWANTAFEGLANQAAFILQKGYFVSLARPYDVDQLAGEPATNHPTMRGVCYTYSEPVVFEAVRSSKSTRDFTNNDENLLHFI